MFPFQSRNTGIMGNRINTGPSDSMMNQLMPRRNVGMGKPVTENPIVGTGPDFSSPGPWNYFGENNPMNRINGMGMNIRPSQQNMGQQNNPSNFWQTFMQMLMKNNSGLARPM